MPHALHLVLYALAFVLFAIAAGWNPNPPPRVSLIALGLAALTLTLIL